MPGDNRRGHKDLQLCRQVHDALALALADIDDPLLDELVLESVTPAPNASRVQVTFVPARPDLDVEAALERLHAHVGELRSEVAAEVSRRRVPELAFQIVPRMPTLPPADSKPPPDSTQ
jgi:ribosome-binding factor A